LKLGRERGERGRKWAIATHANCGAWIRQWKRGRIEGEQL